MGDAPPQVIVYTTSWCPYTRRVRSYLKGRGLAWTEVDIDEDAAAAQKVEAWNGGKRLVPTVDINGQVLANPKPADLDAALGFGDPAR